MVDINALGQKTLHLIWPVKICIKQNTNKNHRMGKYKITDKWGISKYQFQFGFKGSTKMENG